MHIYVTVHAFIFFNTKPFDLWECWTVPSLATTWLHTGNSWQLCLIQTKMGDGWEWLLQHLCHCCKQSVHVSARLCVLFTVLISLKELRHYLNCFGASWGAGQEKKPEYGKKNPPLLLKCQPIFLLCYKWLIANSPEVLKIWPTPDWIHRGFFTVFGLDSIS